MKVRHPRTQNLSRVVVVRQLKSSFGDLELQCKGGAWTVVTTLPSIDVMTDRPLDNQWYPKTERHKFRQDKAAAFAFYDEHERKIAIRAAKRALLNRG